VKKTRAFLIVFVLTVLCFSSLFAFSLAVAGEAPSIQWQKSYTYGDGCSVFQTSDGGYIVSGNDSSSSFLIKTDSQGNQVWTNTYDIGENMTYLAKTNDGAYALAGTYMNKYALLKVDSAGEEVWNKTYSFNAPINYLRAFIQTNDGGYALLGFYFNSSHGGDGQIWLGKTDSSGNLTWNTTISGGESGSPNQFNSPNTIIQTPDGYAITDSNYALNPLQSAYRLIKTDQTGTLLLSQTYGGEGDYHDPECTCGIATSDSGYLLAGFLSFGRGAWMVKTDSQGNMLWNQSYGTGNAAANHLIQTSDGGYSFVGVNNAHEIWQVQTDSEGFVAWNTTYAGTRLSIGLESNYNSLIQTTDGGYVVVGTKDGAVWLAKLEPSTPIASSKPPTVAVPVDALAAIALIVVIAIILIAVVLRRRNRSLKSTD
jgi:hypothetical protein